MLIIKVKNDKSKRLSEKVSEAELFQNTTEVCVGCGMEVLRLYSQCTTLIILILLSKLNSILSIKNF